MKQDARTKIQRFTNGLSGKHSGIRALYRGSAQMISEKFRRFMNQIKKRRSK